MTTTKTKFPSQIFVVHSNEGGADFLMADTDTDGFADGDFVALYELKSEHVLAIERKLVDIDEPASSKKARGAR